MLAGRNLRVALVGAGRMGARTDEMTRSILPPGWFPLSHAEAIASDPSLDFIAICDENAEQLSWAAKQFEVAGIYSNYREMIEKEKPDLLGIATRTRGRCEILEFAAEHGVRGMHVEKPLGNSVEEVRRATTALTRNNVKLTFGARRRHMDVYRKAKKMVGDGAVGELKEIRVSLGRSLLMWNHPHSIDLILYFGGATKVRSVQGSCQIPMTSVHETTIDADPLVEWGVFNLADGLNGVISSAPGFTVELAGTGGILSVLADGARLQLQQVGANGYLAEPVVEGVNPRLSGTQSAFNELAKAVRGEPAQTLSVDELLESQLALFCLAQSSLLNGARVTSAMLDDGFTITGRLGEKYA